jgi:hypothetical protein
MGLDTLNGDLEGLPQAGDLGSVLIAELFLQLLPGELIDRTSHLFRIVLDRVDGPGQNQSKLDLRVGRCRLPWFLLQWSPGHRWVWSKWSVGAHRVKINTK